MSINGNKTFIIKSAIYFHCLVAMLIFSSKNNLCMLYIITAPRVNVIEPNAQYHAKAISHTEN